MTRLMLLPACSSAMRITKNEYRASSKYCHYEIFNVLYNENMPDIIHSPRFKLSINTRSIYHDFLLFARYNPTIRASLHASNLIMIKII